MTSILESLAQPLNSYALGRLPCFRRHQQQQYQLGPLESMPSSYPFWTYETTRFELTLSHINHGAKTHTLVIKTTTLITAH